MDLVVDMEQPVMCTKIDYNVLVAHKTRQHAIVEFLTNFHAVRATFATSALPLLSLKNALLRTPISRTDLLLNFPVVFPQRRIY